LHYVNGIIMLCKNDRHVKKLLVCNSLLNYTRTQRSSHIVSSLSAFVKSVIISNFFSTFTVYDMAGRPTAPVEIVPPNTVIPLRNRDETFNLAS